jgi:hypothetical protein
MATAAPRQAPPPIQVAGRGRRERARTNAASSHGTARLAGETVRWRSTASGDSPAAASATAAAHRGRPTRRASSHSRPRPATVATTISSRPPATAFGARPAAPVSRSQAARWVVASVGATPENVRAASGTPRVAAHAPDTSAPSSPPRAGEPDVAAAAACSAPAATAASATPAAVAPSRTARSCTRRTARARRPGPPPDPGSAGAERRPVDRRGGRAGTSMSRVAKPVTSGARRTVVSPRVRSGHRIG